MSKLVIDKISVGLIIILLLAIIIWFAIIIITTIMGEYILISGSTTDKEYIRKNKLYLACYYKILAFGIGYAIYAGFDIFKTMSKYTDLF